MNKVFLYTISVIGLLLFVCASLALAQWEPREAIDRKLVYPPSIPLSALDRYQDAQVLCYLVKRWRKEWVVQEYSVEPYYPQDGWEWRVVPKEDR